MKEIPVEEIYKKDDKLKKEDVLALMEWIEKQPHLPKISELETALFLHSCYYSNEAAKYTIDTYFTVKTLCPDIFGSKDIKNDRLLQRAMKTVFVGPIRNSPKSNDILLFGKLMDCNPDNYAFAPQLNLFDLTTIIHYLEYGPADGCHIVIDMKGVVFAHFLKLNPVVMKKFLYYLQEGMPIRLKTFHFINIVSFMDKILALMKPFMKKELIDAVYKFIYFVEKYRCKIMDNPDVIAHLTNQVVDESKRQGKPKNAGDLFGVEGSFKKLEVD
uniref:Alpha-tocopherol transfer protein-like n=1 Tax=Diabrotica virgifera virgifera TaxID=50390 RepID=A0A6P7G5V2_DIAVI